MTLSVAFQNTEEYKKNDLLQAPVNCGLLLPNSEPPRCMSRWKVLEMLEVLTDGGEQESDQQKRPLGSSQSHSWPSLKHCSNMETSGQQSWHSAEQRSFRENNNVSNNRYLLQADNKCSES